MYQSLYRKYRPKTFDAVIGQKHITDVLSFSVQNASTSHAYLFCGSRGTGKTTCAKILSRAVNCQAPVNGNPCGKCEACLAMESGNCTDIVEMDAASNNGVNDVREIRDAVVYAPSVLKNRVYIIDEVHMLSVSAFNALLKTLEEPPSNVVFILATTELQKLPATIISRCQRFDFRRISTQDIAEYLCRIAESEAIQLDSDAAVTLARLARGGMRDALSLLELNVRPDRHITLASVREVTGMVGRQEFAKLVNDIADRKTDQIFRTVDTLFSSSKDIAVFWQDLISFYRDMLLVKSTAKAEDFLDLTGDEIEELRACAARFSYASLLWQARQLSDAGIRMQRVGLDRRMEAEFTLVRLTDPASDTSPEALAARLGALEDKVAMGVIPVTSIPIRTTEPNAKEVSASDTQPPAISKQVEKSEATTADAPKMRAVGWFRDVAKHLESSDPGKAIFLANAKAYYCPETKRAEIVLAGTMAQRMVDNSQMKEILIRLISEYEPVTSLVFSCDSSRDKGYQYIDEIIEDTADSAQSADRV